MTFYCSKEHQRLDWKTHKKSCIPVNSKSDTAPKSVLKKTVPDTDTKTSSSPSAATSSSSNGTKTLVPKNKAPQGQEGKAAQRRPRVGLVGWVVRYQNQFSQIWKIQRAGFCQIWNISPAAARQRLLSRVASDVIAPDLSDDSDDVNNMFHISQVTFAALCPEFSMEGITALVEGPVALFEEACSKVLSVTELQHFTFLANNRAKLAGMPLFVGMGRNKKRIDFFLDEAMIVAG